MESASNTLVELVLVHVTSSIPAGGAVVCFRVTCVDLDVSDLAGEAILFVAAGVQLVVLLLLVFFAQCLLPQTQNR